MPETNPQATPVTTPRRMARNGFTPDVVAMYAVTIEERAATEPTDRSMPAETMTKVCPNARIATTAACTPMLSRFWVLRKTGLSSAMTAPRTRSATKAPFCPSSEVSWARRALCVVTVSVDTGGLHFLDGQRHDGVLAGFFAGELADDAALGHDEDAVAHAEHLGQLGGDHEHAVPGVGERVDELVDLHLRTDFDAAGGLV